MNKALTEQGKKIGRLIIISAASGTGKTTLVKALCELDMQLVISVSYTTRQKRPQETENSDYFFTNSETFKEMVAADQFLEYAEIFGNIYGTAKQWVNEQLNLGKDVILEIDYQGMAAVRRLMPDCCSIFILPPSYQELENRLLARGQDNPATIKRRMLDAVAAFAHCHKYDFLVINDKFEHALAELQNIIMDGADRQRLEQPDLSQFVAQLMQQAQR